MWSELITQPTAWREVEFLGWACTDYYNRWDGILYCYKHPSHPWQYGPRQSSLRESIFFSLNPLIMDTQIFNTNSLFFHRCSFHDNTRLKENMVVPSVHMYQYITNEMLNKKDVKIRFGGRVIYDPIAYITGFSNYLMM